MPTVGSFRHHTVRPCRGLGRARNSRYVRVIPVGLPDQRRLVLPDDWPEICIRCAKTRWIIDCAQNRRLYRNVSVYQRGQQRCAGDPCRPLHITSDEPGHFRLFVDGEKLSMLITACFMSIAAWRNWQNADGLQRSDLLIRPRVWDLRFAHSVAYTNSVENALGIEVRNERILFARFCWKSNGCIVIAQPWPLLPFCWF